MIIHELKQILTKKCKAVNKEAEEARRQTISFLGGCGVFVVAIVATMIVAIVSAFRPTTPAPPASPSTPQPCPLPGQKRVEGTPLWKVEVQLKSKAQILFALGRVLIEARNQT